ncbi:holo-ACP synthase [Bacillus infantis]|uniref:holo-ACP synthase n=1 Tax=Bacillus infantis TaxID=324767 RepID=UPI003CEB1724
MIEGIGIDIVEIGRISRMANRAKFSERILTEGELAKYITLSDKRQLEFIAGRFAAKEAFSKANGTGIGSELSFQDIEISNDRKGKPFFSKPEREGLHLSISHSESYAVAQVVIETPRRESVTKKLS